MKFWKRVQRVFNPPNKWNHDAFLLSFPKCGRTWLTLQLGRAISKHFALDVPNLLKLSVFPSLNAAIPSVRITHDDQPHRKRPNELTTTKKKFAGRKVIFMVRDPRDVLVSYYFHKSKREKERDFWWFQKKRRETHTPFKGTLSEFLNVDIGGFDTILRYYNIWAENRNMPAQFLVVRYEDMKSEPARVLRQVLNFVGLECITDDEVHEAIEYARFENMQKLEAGAQAASYKLKPGDKNDPDSFKVRKGKAGGFLECFTPAEIEMLNGKMAAMLTDYYGYEPNVKSVPATP